MKLLITKDTTNVTLLVFIQDSSLTTGAGNTGLLATNIIAYFTRVEDDNDVTIAAISLSDLTGTGTVHTDGGLEEIATTNMPGWYRLDIPDSVCATGARSAGISLIDSGANNIAQVTIEIQLVDVNLEDGVRFGITALPNAAADAALGLPISDAGGLDLDAMNTNINDIETDTAVIGALGAGLTGIPWNSAWDVEVESECNDALVAQKLDHLVAVADADDVVDDSIMAKMVSSAATADWSLFVNTTDSLQAIRDKQTDIEADTNELQGDWTNTGRLDTIIDSILLDTGTTLDTHLLDVKGTAFAKDTHSLTDILADVTGIAGSAMIGTDSAALASVCTEARISELDAGTGGKMANQVDVIETDTTSLNDTKIPDTISLANINTQVDTALSDINLDHLVFTAVPVTLEDAVDTDSILGNLLHDSTGTGTSGGGFNRETDSLEAIRDNMQVAVDAAIDTAISELSVAVPTSTPTLRTGLMLMYMALRNKTTVQTSGTDALEINNNAGTIIAQKLLTDDGSDYVEAQMT